MSRTDSTVPLRVRYDREGRDTVLAMRGHIWEDRVLPEGPRHFERTDRKAMRQQRRRQRHSDNQRLRRTRDWDNYGDAKHPLRANRLPSY